MFSGPVFLDSLRELRLWLSPSASIPWGFLLLALVFTFFLGCCCGICIGLAAASRVCRNLLLQIVALVCEHLLPATGPVRGAASIKRRLLEYRA